MLVLSRKLDQKILIGEEIVITICAIHPSKVRIGIDAPEEIEIRREELPTLDRRQRKAPAE